MFDDYDIFELLEDGSVVWRACVRGRYHKERKLQELAEISSNRLLALNLAAGESLPPSVVRPPVRPPAQFRRNVA